MGMDYSEVTDAALHLKEVPAKAIPKVRGVVVKGAVNIKNQMRRDAEASSSFSAIAPTIDFDIHQGAFGGSSAINAEIGPDAAKDEAAALAGFAYFGGAKGGGGTVSDPREALNAEEPRFLENIAKVAGFVFDA